MSVNEHIAKEDFDRIQEYLKDLILFAHGEILSIKADFANKQNYHIPESSIRIDYERVSEGAFKRVSCPLENSFKTNSI